MLSQTDKMEITTTLWRSLLTEADGCLDPLVLRRVADKRLETAFRERPHRQSGARHAGFVDGRDGLDFEPGFYGDNTEAGQLLYRIGFEAGREAFSKALDEQIARDAIEGRCTPDGVYD